MPNQPQPNPIIVEPIPVPANIAREFQRVFAELDRQGYTSVLDAHHDARLAPSKAVKLDQLIHADIAAEDADAWYAELAELMPPCETVSMAGRRRTEDAPDEDLAFRMFTPAEVVSGMALPDFPSPECTKWSQAGGRALRPLPEGSDG